MTLPAGSRIGPYEVIDSLGAGGMGEVYRARDAKLGREVALKVLPAAFASDRDRVTRFEREAQVLASLNHPNIAHIHGIETASDSPALVMELVEGETLAERLRRGPIGAEDAVPIARQIAEALEAAHERGIIHRDLKPANIKVTDDGVVKVLDFGLAKTIDPTASAASVSQSPTLSIHGTQAGVILGTAPYMSPEQARGKPVDARTDIWAFGAVFFEMLTGHHAFPGDDVSEILANVIKSDPAWDQLPANLPQNVNRVVRRCLQKDRRQRLQHIGDARLELQETNQPDAKPARSLTVSWLERVAWAAMLVAAIIVVAARRQPPAAAAPEMRVDVATPDATVMLFALSPDGQSIAYSARSDRGLQIWVRDLASTTARPIRGSEGGEFPFWSPDSKNLAFFSGGRLKRIGIDSGATTDLGRSLTPAGGTWGADGTILYVPSDNGPVMAVAATGGKLQRVTPAQIAARLPEFLPDGRHFLFFASSGIDPVGVYVGELGSDQITYVTAADWPAHFIADHLLYVRDRQLFAQPFDRNALALSGSPQRIADDILGGLFSANIGVSAGTIAYRRGGGGVGAGRQLIWFDRSGKLLQTVGDEGGLASNPSLSPDGRQLAIQRTTAANVDIWLIDLQRNLPNRLTSNPAVESLPLWSPDGLRLAIGQSVIRGGPAVLRIDRPSELMSLRLPASETPILNDWSRDGRYIMYKAINAERGGFDLWATAIDGDSREAIAIANNAFDERDGQFSPDGKWVAYESDESGMSEIYVQPFPGPGRRSRVSVNGGSQVRWRSDGRELFYVAADEMLMAVPVASSGADRSIGTPVKLFRTSIAPVRMISRQQYVVSKDGQRFLILNSDRVPTPPVTLILNWAGAKR